MRDFISIRFDMESVNHDLSMAAVVESAIDSGMRKINHIRSGSTTDSKTVNLVYRRMSKLEELDSDRRIP